MGFWWSWVTQRATVKTESPLQVRLEGARAETQMQLEMGSQLRPQVLASQA